MKTIGLLEFRKNAEDIIRRARRGERVVLSYRGKPVVQLSPYRPDELSGDDAFYRIAEQAEQSGNMTNQDMDRLVYGV